MPDDRDRQPPKSKPLVQPGSVPIAVLDRDDITGQFDTSTYEGKLADEDARKRRLQKDAELAAVNTIDVRARMTTLELKHDQLALVVAKQDGKLDAVLDYSERADAERQRRVEREEAARQADAELADRAAERRAKTRRLLLTKVAPIIAALTGLVTAIAALKGKLP